MSTCAGRRRGRSGWDSDWTRAICSTIAAIGSRRWMAIPIPSSTPCSTITAPTAPRPDRTAAPTGRCCPTATGSPCTIRGCNRRPAPCEPASIARGEGARKGPRAEVRGRPHPRGRLMTRGDGELILPAMPSLPPVFDPFNPAHAALYDEMPLWSALAGQLLLEHVPLPARGRVLDVGCGTGFPLLELAERLGPAVHVLGVGPRAWDTARAHGNVRTWGVPNAALVRGDGARLPLPAASCALVVSNLGVNNFADPHTAL